MKTILQPLSQFDTTLLLRRVKLENPRRELIKQTLYLSSNEYKLDGTWYRVNEHFDPSILSQDIECFKVIHNAE